MGVNDPESDQWGKMYDLASSLRFESWFLFLFVSKQSPL